METKEQEIYQPGTAVYSNTYGKTGYIVKASESNGNSFMIAGGMVPIKTDYKIVWLGKETKRPAYCDTLADSMVKKYIEHARQYEIASIENVAELVTQAEAAQDIERETRNKASAEATRKREAFLIQAREKIPTWAKAVIIAELRVNDSDLIAEYHGHTTSKSLILAFSKHTRDLFPEMRKAALNHPDTAFLFDAPDSAEHREKYSMGSGFYLKNGWRDSSGWAIKKRHFFDSDKAENLPTGEWSLPENPERTTASPANTDGGIEEHTHTKRGFQMFIVLIPGRVERDEFNRLRQLCKEAGGWYSRKWRTTPGGFAFEHLAAAEQFQKDVFPSD